MWAVLEQFVHPLKGKTPSLQLVIKIGRAQSLAHASPCLVSPSMGCKVFPPMSKRTRAHAASRIIGVQLLVDIFGGSLPAFGRRFGPRAYGRSFLLVNNTKVRLFFQPLNKFTESEFVDRGVVVVIPSIVGRYFFI